MECPPNNYWTVPSNPPLPQISQSNSKGWLVDPRPQHLDLLPHISRLPDGTTDVTLRRIAV